MSRKHRRARTANRYAVAAEPNAARSHRHRHVGVDALRGAALCLMFVYHFAFDLRFYGVTNADFEHHLFWLGFRALIVGAFMVLVGVSLTLADRAGRTALHFWRRVGVIGACAFAVSAGSWLVFPRTFIYFGILHCIAVASVLGRPLTRRPRAALGVGSAIIAAGLLWSNPAFDAPALSWIGFSTAKPATEDYVPLAPWAGFVFIGIAAGRALAHGEFRVPAPLAHMPAWLTWLGRHSLLLYMVHQPILLGALWLAVRH